MLSSAAQKAKRMNMNTAGLPPNDVKASISTGVTNAAKMKAAASRLSPLRPDNRSRENHSFTG